MTSTSPAFFAPVLERLRSDAAKYYGYPDVRLVPAQYDQRPFSHVLRIEVHKDASERPTACLFAKVFKTDPARMERMQQRVAKDYDTTLAIYERLQQHADLGVVPPVVCYPDLLTIVTEEVKGSTLLEHLTNRATWWRGAGETDIERVLDNVGRWIHVFQDVGGSAEGGSADQMREYIDHRLRRLVRLPKSGFDEAARTEVLGLVGSLSDASESSEWSQVPVHSDMALGNILVTSSGIVVLDFAMAKSGNRLQDVSRVFVQLDLLNAKPFIRPSVIQKAKDALLRGFDATVRDSQPMFRLMVLRHRLNHLIGLLDGDHRFAERIYNAVLIRRHLRWIREAVAQGSSSARHA